MKVAKAWREGTVRMIRPFETNRVFGVMIGNREENGTRLVEVKVTEIDRIGKCNYRSEETLKRYGVEFNYLGHLRRRSLFGSLRWPTMRCW